MSPARLLETCQLPTAPELRTSSARLMRASASGVSLPALRARAHARAEHRSGGDAARRTGSPWRCTMLCSRPPAARPRSLPHQRRDHLAPSRCVQGRRGISSRLPPGMPRTTTPCRPVRSPRPAQFTVWRPLSSHQLQTEGWPKNMRTKGRNSGQRPVGALHMPLPRSGPGCRACVNVRPGELSRARQLYC